ncbi:unnamed protein product [Lymnaea stagnalis]|uniref:dolichyl-P-Man:Man5GlcNAc2-PP-dolichol alpha-1,3-mannosyltransferase n=1 Tax=Lymnaea stagnalis TaxID=6523 RepID=A0AAV2HGG3_LYMST
MAGTKKVSASASSTNKSYFNLIKRMISDPAYPLPAMIALLLAEVVVNLLVIVKIKYTEIDWVAYMQEVEGVVNGTYDYMELKGDTGPLVYPAGFVYVFMGLYFLTDLGVNITRAQYIFAGLYIINLLVVFDIYRQAKRIPPYALFFMCALSYRIHSIFVLRLFNDPVAMLFLYMSVNLFMRCHWSWGCLFYSLGVSIKMNLLLFAPALLFLLVVTQGIKGTIKHLTICGLPQIILGLPFLISNPTGYIMRSFDLGRQFFYIWTVNWRLLPEEIFLNRYFQAGLLLVHVFTICLFLWFRWRRCFPSLKIQWSNKNLKQHLSPDQILFPLFTANFIGMCFSRSLHYQFYVWYFHSLHYLVWCTPYPDVVRILLLGVIEFCWNTYPSTVTSSSLLHVSHAAILIGLWLVIVKRTLQPGKHSVSTKDTSIGKVKVG